MQRALYIILLLVTVQWACAQDDAEDAAYQAMVDSIEASFNYQTGTIDLRDGLAKLVVPDGYRYLGPEQSAYVLEDLWDNPPDPVLGLLFPRDVTPLGDEFTYVVSIAFSEEGYIDDDDAKDLDYDELLEGMIKDFDESSTARVEMGYGTMELVGWASPPFYDAENKKLHWAKDLIFDGSATHTLNYNIRILGRRGYIELNVIGDLDRLSMVQRNVDDFLGSVEFNEGHTYAEFDPDIDELAAYGIGGLIAGKVLLKVGLLAGLLKFWKLILIGLVAGGAAIKKFFFGAKSNDDDDDDEKGKKKLYRPDPKDPEQEVELDEEDIDEEAVPHEPVEESLEEEAVVEEEIVVEDEPEEPAKAEETNDSNDDVSSDESSVAEAKDETKAKEEEPAKAEEAPEEDASSEASTEAKEEESEGDREVTDADFGPDPKDKN